MKSDDGRKEAVLVPVRIQGAAVAQFLYRVEDFVAFVCFGIIAFRVVPQHAVFIDEKVLLLHQLHVFVAEAHDIHDAVQIAARADYVPEQRRHFVETGDVFIFASKSNTYALTEECSSGIFNYKSLYDKQMFVVLGENLVVTE